MSPAGFLKVRPMSRRNGKMRPQNSPSVHFQVCWCGPVIALCAISVGFGAGCDGPSRPEFGQPAEVATAESVGGGTDRAEKRDAGDATSRGQGGAPADPFSGVTLPDPFIGLAGAATSNLDCEAGVLRCATGDVKGIEKCSTGGTWLLQEQCAGETPYCLRGSCVSCEPQASRCDGAALQACSTDGIWKTSAVCAEGTTCLERTQACGSCTEGETQCSDGGTLATCSHGEFVVQPCAAEAPFCVQGVCRSCDPGSSQPHCEALTPVVCVAGEWEAQSACVGEKPVCNDALGACVACETGKRKCSADGQLETCDEFGQWTATACPSTSPACLGGACVACDPRLDKPRCRNDAVETCSAAGAWELAQSCAGDTPVCIESSGTCGSCKEGEVQCSDNGTASAKCNAAGKFVDQACPASTPICSAGACQECSAQLGPKYKCAGNTPQVCSGNRWVSQAPCSGQTPKCDPQTGECVCKDGEVRCQGSALQRCQGAAWVQQQVCAGELPICDALQGRCGCKNGETKCVVGTDDSVLECQAGVWVEEICPTAGPVCYNGACVECVPGSPSFCPERSWDYETRTYIGENVRQWCTSAAQVATETCPYICNRGACVDTRQVAGSYTCNQGAGQMCQAPQICCINQAQTCEASADDCGQYAVGQHQAASQFSCDDPSDCASGQVCCHHLNPAPGPNVIKCETPANCADTDTFMGAYDQVVCGPGNPCKVGVCELIASAVGASGVSSCNFRK